MAAPPSKTSKRARSPSPVAGTSAQTADAAYRDAYWKAYWEREACDALGSDTLPDPPLRASTPERPATMVDFLDSDEVSDSPDGEGGTASPSILDAIPYRPIPDEVQFSPRWHGRRDPYTRR